MAEVIHTDGQRMPGWAMALILVCAIPVVFIIIKEGSLLTGIVFPAVLAFMFSMSVRCEVRRDAVVVSFRPLKRRTVPLEDIQRVEAITYRPMRDYGGWGIKYSGKNKGWAYTIHGSKGVRMTLSDGKTLLVGARQPDELAAAIQRAKESHRSDGEG